MSGMEEVFGPVISSYSRAQAIADGQLVDISEATDTNGRNLCKDAGFKYPIALSLEAFNQTLAAGGRWVDTENGQEMQLPKGQDVSGRIWDVLMMLKFAIRASSGGDRMHFQVRVSGKVVKLWSLCGPGDDAEPVITIMVEGED